MAKAKEEAKSRAASPSEPNELLDAGYRKIIKGIIKSGDILIRDGGHLRYIEKDDSLFIGSKIHSEMTVYRKKEQ